MAKDYIQFKNVDGETKQTVLCRNCERKFYTMHEFEHHAYAHHGIRRYKCPTCGDTYVTEPELFKHTLRHQEETYACDICHARYARKQDRKTHRAMHFVNTQTTSVAPASKSGDLYKTLKSNGVIHYMCLVCHSVYPKLCNIVLHVKMHLPKEHLCPDCGLYFRTAGSLTQHRITHLNKKKFPCDSCNLAFPNFGSLENHVRAAHYKLQPFRCAFCLAEFRSLEILDKHRLCNECNTPNTPKLVPTSLGVRPRQAKKPTIINRKTKRALLENQTDGCSPKRAKQEHETSADGSHPEKLIPRNHTYNLTVTREERKCLLSKRADEEFLPLFAARITRSTTLRLQPVDKDSGCSLIPPPTTHSGASETSSLITKSSPSSTIPNTCIQQFMCTNYPNMDVGIAAAEPPHYFVNQEDHNDDSNDCFSQRFLSTVVNFNVQVESDTAIPIEKIVSTETTSSKPDDEGSILSTPLLYLTI